MQSGNLMAAEKWIAILAVKLWLPVLFAAPHLRLLQTDGLSIGILSRSSTLKQDLVYEGRRF
jgi:hypothetical protein